MIVQLMIVILKVLSSAILQQVFVVEYVVQNQMCEDCHRREAQDFWRALVQVRQKVISVAFRMVYLFRRNESVL